MRRLATWMRATVAAGAMMGATSCWLTSSFDDLKAACEKNVKSGACSNPATGCEADLANDSKNCGACKHDCQGGDCKAGVCQPVVIAHDLPMSPWGVAVDDAHVYWAS